MRKFSKSNRNWNFTPAPDVKFRIKFLRLGANLVWLETKQIYCIRSYGSKSHATARIWGLPRVWQAILKLPSAYIIEVISERFDKLPKDLQDKILLHELAHIPKNFSGALVAHKRRGGVNRELIERLFAQLNKR